jgi:hypothetical protein
MADAATSTTLLDGDRLAIIQLTSTSDGTGESAVKKVDVSALQPNNFGKACTRCSSCKNLLLNFWHECKTFMGCNN